VRGRNRGDGSRRARAGAFQSRPAVPRLVALAPGGPSLGLTALVTAAAKAAGDSTFAAVVDTDASPATRARFGAGPAVLLLKDRSMYRYTGAIEGDGAEADLASFARSPTSDPLDVPPPPSPLDALLRQARATVNDATARLDLDALLARAQAAVAAAPGGAGGAAAAGLGGLLVTAIAIARAGRNQAAAPRARRSATKKRS